MELYGSMYTSSVCFFDEENRNMTFKKLVFENIQSATMFAEKWFAEGTSQDFVLIDKVIYYGRGMSIAASSRDEIEKGFHNMQSYGGHVFFSLP